MNHFLNNILALSPNFLLFLGGGFVVLALYWYNTGRFFVVGWLVWLVWRCTITPLAFCLWFFASVVNGFFDTIRGLFFFMWLVRGGLVFADWYAMKTPEYNAFIIPLLIISFIFFYLTKYGLPENKIASWIKHSPEAKRTPIKKPKLKPLKPEPKAEDLPKPEVKPLLKSQGYFETEAEILNKLDAHLKHLINGG